MEQYQKQSLRERLVVPYLVLVEVRKQEDKFKQHNTRDQNMMRMNKAKTHSLESMEDMSLAAITVEEVVIVEVLEEVEVEAL